MGGGERYIENWGRVDRSIPLRFSVKKWLDEQGRTRQLKRQFHKPNSPPPTVGVLNAKRARTADGSEALEEIHTTSILDLEKYFRPEWLVGSEVALT